jgi:hypothetical protein
LNINNIPEGLTKNGSSNKEVRMKRKNGSILLILLALSLASCSIPPVSAPTLTPTVLTASQSPTAVIVSPTAGVTQASAVPATATAPAATALAPTQAVPTAQPTTTQPPAPTPSQARTYAVILVEGGDVLNIRSAAGAGSAVVGQFPANAINVQSTGASAVSGGNLWLQVSNPSGGAGWVNAYYLTEQVSAQTFCSDARVTALLDSFEQSVTNGDDDLLGTLVSPLHGLELHFWHGGPSVNYTPEEASWVFDSTFDVNWGSGPSGLDDVGTFSEFPLPFLEQVFDAGNDERQCNDLNTTNLFVQPWPVEYANVNFYALHKPGSPDIELDWVTWLTGVEYVNGNPYLFALKRFIWDP